jgi:hypothetical protein
MYKNQFCFACAIMFGDMPPVRSRATRPAQPSAGGSKATRPAQPSAGGYANSKQPTSISVRQQRETQQQAKEQVRSGREAAAAKKREDFRPSQKYMSKYGVQADLTSNTHKTRFASAYAGGHIPACIDHGCNTNKLKWSTSPDESEYDPLLVLCFEAIVETEHPYLFLARQMLTDMLNADGATQKCQPLVPALVGAARGALLSKDEGAVSFAITAVTMLSRVVGQAMNPQLKMLVAQLHRHALKSRSLSGLVTTALQTLEENGGPEALKVIKAKIPTYCTVNL